MAARLPTYRKTLLGGLGLMLAAPVIADDVSDSDRILCAMQSATICVDTNDCFAVTPQEIDLPQFVIIDRDKKTVSTTKNAQRQRVTQVNNVIEEEDRLVMQGIERGRAYSFVIEQDLGLLTAALARDGVTLSVFGACTDADTD